jgi:hypothetical protein
MLEEHGKPTDSGVHKRAHKTHHRPIVAPLPALQTELKHSSAASVQLNTGSFRTPDARVPVAWTDSAHGARRRSWDTSTGGAKFAASGAEDARFGWAVRQLETFWNEKTKLRLEWGTHDATAGMTPFDENDSSPWCMCTTILCDRAARVLNNVLSLDSPEMRFSPDVAVVVTSHPRPNSLTLTAFSRLPFGLVPTSFPMRLVWREECRAADAADASQKTLFLVFSPDPTYPATHSEGKFTAVMLLKDLGGDRTQLEYLFRIDLRRQMQARSLICSRVAEHSLRVARHIVTHLKLRLLAQRSFRSIETSDAAVLAQALLSKRGSKLGRGHVRVCIEKYRALAELRSRYPWIEPMLVEILRIKLSILSFGRMVANSPSQVTPEQGSHIGKSLAFFFSLCGRDAPPLPHTPGFGSFPLFRNFTRSTHLLSLWWSRWQRCC